MHNYARNETYDRDTAQNYQEHQRILHHAQYLRTKAKRLAGSQTQPTEPQDLVQAMQALQDTQQELALVRKDPRVALSSAEQSLRLADRIFQMAVKRLHNAQDAVTAFQNRQVIHDARGEEREPAHKAQELRQTLAAAKQMRQDASLDRIDAHHAVEVARQAIPKITQPPTRGGDRPPKPKTPTQATQAVKEAQQAIVGVQVARLEQQALEEASQHTDGIPVQYLLRALEDAEVDRHNARMDQPVEYISPVKQAAMDAKEAKAVVRRAYWVEIAQKQAIEEAQISAARATRQQASATRDAMRKQVQGEARTARLARTEKYRLERQRRSIDYKARCERQGETATSRSILSAQDHDTFEQATNRYDPTRQAARDAVADLLLAAGKTPVTRGAS